jgi:hypothetical protein
VRAPVFLWQRQLRSADVRRAGSGFDQQARSAYGFVAANVGGDRVGAGRAGRCAFGRGVGHAGQSGQSAAVGPRGLDYSSGQVEGNVNRIKMIKRQMFGRAKFDLLRKRVLAR